MFYMLYVTERNKVCIVLYRIGNNSAKAKAKFVFCVAYCLASGVKIQMMGPHYFSKANYKIP